MANGYVEVLAKKRNKATATGTIRQADIRGADKEKTSDRQRRKRNCQLKLERMRQTD